MIVTTKSLKYTNVNVLRGGTDVVIYHKRYKIIKKY